MAKTPCFRPRTGKHGRAGTPLSGATAFKPGPATRPFFGVWPTLVDEKGAFIEGAASGNLVLFDSRLATCAPSMAITPRFFDTYFRTYPGLYFTCDGCCRDEDGYFWITGRVGS